MGTIAPRFRPFHTVFPALSCSSTSNTFYIFNLAHVRVARDLAAGHCGEADGRHSSRPPAVREADQTRKRVAVGPPSVSLGRRAPPGGLPAQASPSYAALPRRVLLLLLRVRPRAGLGPRRDGGRRTLFPVGEVEERQAVRLGQPRPRAAPVGRGRPPHRRARHRHGPVLCAGQEVVSDQRFEMFKERPWL